MGQDGTVMSVTSDEKRVLEIDRYHVLLAPPRADLVALVEVAAQVAQVPLADVLSSTGCLLDQEYLLQSQDEGQRALQECFVSLRLHWVAGPSQPAHHTH